MAKYGMDYLDDGCPQCDYVLVEKPHMENYAQCGRCGFKVKQDSECAREIIAHKKSFSESLKNY